MIKDLIINVSLLISFISIAGHLLKEREIGIGTPFKLKLLAGTTSGILGMTLIYFGFHPSPNTVIDFRNIVLTMAAIYGGTIPLLICGLSIAIFRLSFFGLSFSSYAAAVTTAAICIGDIIISKQKARIRVRWGACTIYNTIAISINLCFVLKGNTKLFDLISIYFLFSIIVSLLTYSYVNYSLTANKLYRKLKKESSKDFLTGLNNVRSFDKLFNDVIKGAKEKSEPVSLLMIDIDFFKKVNDTYGHHQGDIVLQKLGKLLTKCSRSFDIVSRNGGEEFTVLLLDCKLDQAVTIAERIRTAVESSNFILSDNTKIKITVSIGIASFPESTEQEESLLELADTALYFSKKTGRNKVSTTEDIKLNKQNA